MLMTIPPATSLKLSWQTAPEPVILPPDEVHVWRADLDVGPAALLRLRETLSPDEQARAERFYSPLERARYTAGRGILRALLARYLGTPGGDLRFCCNAHGKPALVPGSGAEDLRFNLSHSHRLALFAFAFRREVGVDLEYVRPSLTDDPLPERFFSTQEVIALRALPESAQTEAFFNCWTRKEAYIKARGRGLSISLASFAVSLAPAQLTNLPITGNDGPEAGRWSLRALAPGQGYVAAIAAEGADWSLALWQWV
jgi:4'-phosphopantetheinyl transferase